MSEMIERVARAIAESHNVDPDDKVNFPDRTSVMWKEFVPQARAAIEAMRVPERTMLFKGSIALKGHETAEGRDDAHKCWQAMIDAARQEPTD